MAENGTKFEAELRFPERVSLGPYVVNDGYHERLNEITDWLRDSAVPGRFYISSRVFDWARPRHRHRRIIDVAFSEASTAVLFKLRWG